MGFFRHEVEITLAEVIDCRSVAYLADYVLTDSFPLRSEKESVYRCEPFLHGCCLRYC